MRRSASIVLLLGACAPQASSSPPKDNTGERVEILRVADVKWEALNPARGDASPMAANVWGDRTTSGAAGFLVRFADGFSSPPHIHNVSYRGVVIRGRLHNDDPEAAPMWMPAGSYWTQPKGAVHITSAQSTPDSAAYIEIEDGPYLVRSPDETFSTGEHPLNVHASNLVWSNAAPETPPGAPTPRIAFLWGEPGTPSPHGVLLETLPGSMHAISSDASFRAVVIQGAPTYRGPTGPESVTLDPGSLVEAERVELSCGSGDACVFYVRLSGQLAVD